MKSSEYYEHQLNEEQLRSDQLQDQIDTLKCQLGDLRAELELKNWMDHPHMKKAASLNLPAPRLQLTWLPLSEDWSRKECIYSLVLPLGKWDIRREGEDGKRVRSEWHAEIGRTKSYGGPRKPVFGEIVDTPFRDGAHAKWDAFRLNLPLFAVCDGLVTELEPEAQKEASETP